MKNLFVVVALCAVSLAGVAAESAKPEMDAAMKERCDKMMSEKADAKAMKQAGCPMAKKADKAKKKIEGHDHGKVHKTM